MHFVTLLSTALLAPLGALAAPTDPTAVSDLVKRENLCHLKAPPVLCTPNASVTVEETAIRAYKFYRAFVTDGDPRTMFSLMDNVYQVKSTGQVVTRISCMASDKELEATSSRLCQRAAGHLVSVLQRQQNWQRVQHILVL